MNPMICTSSVGTRSRSSPSSNARGSVVAAQKEHFKAILTAAPDLPAVIYNSPYYGFATRADLFFALRAEHPNLVGFKEFGGPADMRYAAENITSGDDALTLMVGVDTGVYHGFVNCGAGGAITGIGNQMCPGHSQQPPGAPGDISGDALPFA